LPAEGNGILNTIAKEGDVLEIGAVIASISGGAGAAKANTNAPAKEEQTETKTTGGTSYADKTPSPAAAKILAEKGIDPKSINGTGVGGRITKDDANKAESTKPKAESSSSSAKAAAPQQNVAGDRSERREKMTNLRKTI